MLRRQTAYDRRQFTAAIPDADVAELYALVRPRDARVRHGRGPQKGTAAEQQRSPAEIFMRRGRGWDSGNGRFRWHGGFLVLAEYTALPGEGCQARTVNIITNSPKEL